MREKTNGKADKHVKKEKRGEKHKRKILKYIIIKLRIDERKMKVRKFQSHFYILTNPCG